MIVSESIQLHMSRIIGNLARQGFLYKNLPQYLNEMTKSIEHHWAGIYAIDFLKRESEEFKTMMKYHVECYKSRNPKYMTMYRKVVEQGKEKGN